ncbi:MAG: DNA polymerase III subunit delta [Candidatus Omnitrophica bacterium]|nr:DNA polymerase III subunit delta [Candidatus Omnitrophota bacterium]
MNYLVTGDDTYIREKEILKIKGKFLDSSSFKLNYAVYPGTNIDDSLDSLRTMPFLSSKRVALIRDAHQISAGDADKIETYLKNPSDTGILMLSADSSFCGKKYCKKICSLVEIVKADKPTASTMKRWIHVFFEKEKIEISQEAVQLIVELKGMDTVGIKEELEKLVSFSSGEKIEISHVERLISRSAREMIFKLTDAVTERDAVWVFRILGDLYAEKKKPHEIIGYLGWYTKIMKKILLLSGRGMPTNRIAAELGYSSGYVRRLEEKARKYSAKRMAEWGSFLFETDKEIKTGRKKPETAVEMMLVSLMNA